MRQLRHVASKTRTGRLPRSRGHRLWALGSEVTTSSMALLPACAYMRTRLLRDPNQRLQCRGHAVVIIAPGHGPFLPAADRLHLFARVFHQDGVPCVLEHSEVI